MFVLQQPSKSFNSAETNAVADMPRISITHLQRCVKVACVLADGTSLIATICYGHIGAAIAKQKFQQC